MDLDSVLDPALTLSWIRIRIWIQFLLRFGSDSQSVKLGGFGFGLGFNLYYGSGRIQNPLSLTDSDLDSICNTVQVGFRIQLVNGSRLGFNLFYKSGRIQNPLGLMDLD